jgi:predicted acylesterase/phospholipase RssA
MRGAATYAQWASLAEAYDRDHGLDEWKERDAGENYDHRFVRDRLEQIQGLLKAGDYQRLIFVLNVDIPFYGSHICRPALYSKAMFGTKQLIHDYITTVCSALEALVAVDPEIIPPVEKTEFFRRVSRSCGHSALMLSGGAVLGFFHAGVLKALFDQDLLPRVISGSSAGAIFAAVACTHSDDELRDRLTLDNLHLEAENTCAIRPDVSLLENQNSRVDAERLRCYLEQIIPDWTFREAYAATGRSLNITVTGLKPQQESLLLNPISAPNVFIRSAVMASCAIYGIYPPVTLTGKDAAGERIDYLPHLQWIDGSFVDDLPAKRLARLYGINHFISSMTNPAALALTPNPDFETNLFTKTFNFQARMFKKFTTESLKLSRDYLRIRSPAVSLLQHLSYSILAQEYTADINIFLRNRWDHPMRLLDAPSREAMQRLIREGELSTWEKIEMVRDCTAISRTLEKILRSRIWNKD